MKSLLAIKEERGFLCFKNLPFLKRRGFAACILAIALLCLASPCTASVITITASVLNAVPNVSDENVSPTNWAGTGTLIFGFQCSDPNGISDMNKANAAITGANTADINNISYTVSGNVVIIALDISSYITTKGTYYATPFCVDDANGVGVGTQITAYYVDPADINVHSPVQDANINGNLTISFDVNKNAATDVNQASITIDLNGTASAVFNNSTDCTGFSGHFYCSYTETGLASDADNNVSFNAADNSGNAAAQVERIVHYDATAPVVSSVSASESGSNVIVSWSGSDGFTGIETYYVRADSGSWLTIGLVTSYTFSGHSSASHTYDVKARDYADNNSLIVQASYSPSVTPTPTPPGPGGGGGRPPTPPEEGIFEIEIVRIDDPVDVSERFDFTYHVKNNTSVGDNAYIEYWLEKNGEKVVSGSETIYLLSGQEMEVSENLLLLEGMDGSYDFYLVLKREEQKTLARIEPTNIMLGAPLALELKITNLEPGKEDEPLSFSIEIGSNKDESLPILVKEKLYKDRRIVWEKKQTVAVTVFERFLEEVYGLGPGNYKLEVSASFEDKEVKDEKEFERKPKAIIPLPEPDEMPLFLLAIIPWILLLLILAWLALFYKLVLKKREQGLSHKLEKGLRHKLERILSRKLEIWEKAGYLVLAGLTIAILYLLFLYWQLGAIA